jgi:hypothetical protein
MWASFALNSWWGAVKPLRRKRPSAQSKARAAAERAANRLDRDVTGEGLILVEKRVRAAAAEIARAPALGKIDGYIGITPLEYMLDCMACRPPADADARTVLGYRELCFEAAKAAAPYCHPKLASIEHKGQGAGGAIPVELNIKFV